MTDSSQLTYIGVLLAVLAEQLYLPIPSPIFLMAAGALAARGKMSTSIIVLLAVLACLSADTLWFWFGRRWGSKAIRLICRFTAGPQGSSKNAHQNFRRYGLAVLCVAKFLPGVNAVLPPLVAAEGVSITGFFGFDAVGSLLWSGFYTELGYLFSNELDVVFRWAKHLGTALGLVIIVPDRPLCRLAGVDSTANGPPASAAAHQSGDAGTQTEIQEQDRGARPVGFRR